VDVIEVRDGLGVVEHLDKLGEDEKNIVGCRFRSSTNTAMFPKTTSETKEPFQNLAKQLGLVEELDRLKSLIHKWVECSNPEIVNLLRWQLVSCPKYFRPFTIFCCHRAVSREPVSRQVMLSAVALELFHNVSLILDDILDRSRSRRGRLTLHCRFGSLPALMTAGYVTAGGFEIVSRDGYSVRLLAEVMQRLGAAECFQWRLRRQPLGIADWRAIAAEDTGSMFETCACLGTRDDRLRKFGRLLGMLYHGCDDVADARGAVALGGGGNADLRDGILTLPAAIAIQDPQVAVLFRTSSSEAASAMMVKIAAAVPEAESVLDELAAEAEAEATRNADDPAPLLDLLRHTRTLSGK
jgi:geranylgeranyl pyrophosphate synthase